VELATHKQREGKNMQKRVGEFVPGDRVMIHPYTMVFYTFLSMRDGNHLQRGYRVCQFRDNEGREFGQPFHVNNKFTVSEPKN
jgi:hypothetical protein